MFQGNQRQWVSIVTNIFIYTIWRHWQCKAIHTDHFLHVLMSNLFRVRLFWVGTKRFQIYGGPSIYNSELQYCKRVAMFGCTVGIYIMNIRIMETSIFRSPLCTTQKENFKWSAHIKCFLMLWLTFSIFCVVKHFLVGTKQQ